MPPRSWLKFMQFIRLPNRIPCGAWMNGCSDDLVCVASYINPISPIGCLPEVFVTPEGVLHDTEEVGLADVIINLLICLYFVLLWYYELQEAGVIQQAEPLPEPAHPVPDNVDEQPVPPADP